MLAVASLGALFSFLLAIRLGRGAAGAPAFAAVLFLIASPMFMTQSMMALPDMPVMTLTALALLLFFAGEYAWCAAASVLLVLVKETAITTPAVFAAWLLFKEKRVREAMYFTAPAVALAVWLVVLHRANGHWLGNEGFAADNVSASLTPVHFAGAVLRNAWVLFAADGKFLGTIALWVGWRALGGRDWQVAFAVALAQIGIVTVFGGAVLERYLLPVLPILFAAMAVAASVYTKHWRWASHAVMIVWLLAGWFWVPRFSFATEDSKAVIDFIELQGDAAAYLGVWAPTKRIASMWPFTDAIRRPEFGYVRRPLKPVQVRGFDLASLADLNRKDYDLLVVFSRNYPVDQGFAAIPEIRSILRRYFGYRPEADSEELRAGLGLIRLMSWSRGGQSITVYGPLSN
jgi:4-amino-4-deoxy-L-arabinose transferase-like glycosyltransferase